MLRKVRTSTQRHAIHRGATYILGSSTGQGLGSSGKTWHLKCAHYASPNHIRVGIMRGLSSHRQSKESRGIRTRIKRMLSPIFFR